MSKLLTYSKRYKIVNTPPWADLLDATLLNRISVRTPATVPTAAALVASSASSAKDQYSEPRRGSLNTSGVRRYSSGWQCELSARRHCSDFHKYSAVMNTPDGLFRGCLDRFNGITVESEQEYEESGEFAPKLEKSLDYWIKNKQRAIWFKVQTQHADWIPQLTKFGFDFHHAMKGLVVMCRWLPEDEYENLPVYAHTMVGVGGLVVNDDNEVLVVSEKYSLIPNSWKLPGGYVEPRENLVDAAIREVREETGIDSEFRTVVSIRHSHRGGYGCSDIYVVIALKPKHCNLKRCEREIADLKWMPAEEYLNNPNVHETNRKLLHILFDYEKRGLQFSCEKRIHQVLKKEYCLYYMDEIQVCTESDDQRRGKTSSDVEKAE